MIITKQLNEFVNYCFGFYGERGVYELSKCVTLDNRKRVTVAIHSDIQKACEQYMYNLMTRKYDHQTWGDGDSVDRERVRAILEDEFGFEEMKTVVA